MPDISWITPKVAIGSEPSASWVSAMRTQGITDVLDLRGEPRAREVAEPELYAGTPIRYHYLPMLDRGGREPVEAYVRGVQIIDCAVRSGGKILVHCAAGISRSPSMVYAYLRSIRESSRAEAWEQIRSRRRVASQQYFDSADAALPQIAPVTDCAPVLQTPSSASDNTTAFVVAGVILLGGLSFWYYRTRR